MDDFQRMLHYSYGHKLFTTVSTFSHQATN
jgi:hypothetical protein